MGAQRLATIATITLGLTGVAHAQLLDRASEAVRGDDDRSSSRDDDDDDDSSLLDRASDAVREPSRSYDYDDDRDDYAGGASIAGGVSVGAIDGYGVDNIDVAYVLGPYPYANGARGYSIEDTGDNARTAGMFDLEGGYALGGAFRAGVGARVLLDIPLDILARYSMFIEPLESGVQMAALGRAGLAWRMLELPALHVRVGGGLRHFQDAAGGVFGVDTSLGVDIFPGSPWLISVEGSIGFVGQAMVAQVRASVGLAIDLLEVYAGYDYEGLVAAEHVDLGGPMLGIRAWL